jgi:hypothetical protein
VVVQAVVVEHAILVEIKMERLELLVKEHQVETLRFTLETMTKRVVVAEAQHLAGGIVQQERLEMVALELPHPSQELQSPVRVVAVVAVM